MITAAQCRAARAWLNMTQAKLASIVGCAVSTVVYFERGRDDIGRLYVDAFQRALEDRGIQFPNNGIDGTLVLAMGGPNDPQTEHRE